jgi:hypothetical protein
LLSKEQKTKTDIMARKARSVKEQIELLKNEE